MDAVCRDSRAAFARAGRTHEPYKKSGLRWILQLTGLDAMEGALLDVGADDNVFGAELLLHNSAITSVAGVDVWRPPTLRSAPGLTFQQLTSWDTLPAGDGTFDVVQFRYSLHHMLQPAHTALIAEALRVLRPGGTLIVQDQFYGRGTPLTDNEVSREYHRLELDEQREAAALMDASVCFSAEEQMPSPFVFHTADEWVKRISDQGFAEVEMTYWGHMFVNNYPDPMMVITARRP